MRNETQRRFARLQWALFLLSVVFALVSPIAMHAQERVIHTAHERVTHTNPLNLQPEIRAAYARFYTLDYDGALSRFQK
ncbi:MAG TPA: hypothetical protein VE218_00390, partial [Acidobacteriaceae bacterium]|nr:hypothetical protein [Acidobacteriaceae bacterium]